MQSTTHRDLEIHHLVGERRHFVVETEPVLARGLRREDEVALSFLLTLHDLLLVGPHHLVVDVEGATGLDLFSGLSERSEGPHPLSLSLFGEGAYREIKGHLGVGSLDERKETRLLAGPQLVRQRRAVHAGDGHGQQTE